MERTFPLSTTNDSSLVGCRWIGISVPGSIAFSIGSANFALSGLAVGSLVGIILNAILPGKDYNFNEEAGSETGADLSGISEKELKEESDKKASK